MAMLHKFMSGTRACDNTKTVTGGYGGVVYCGNEITNENPATPPTDTRTTQKAGEHYDKPYTRWDAKYRSTTRQRNLGGATKIDGTTVVDDETIKWFNLMAIWFGRKVAKRYSLYGVAPTAVNTKLWDA